MNRSSVLYGPAFVTWNGGTYYTQDAIVMEMAEETFDIQVSAFGNVSQRLSQRVLRISFTPCGEWEADTKSILFSNGEGTSFSTLRVGESIIGATDRNMVITPLNGKEPFTLKNACISKLSNLRFTATQTLLGPVEFMVIGTNDTDWSVADSLFAIGVDIDPATITHTPFDLAAIVTKGYQLQWTGITGFTAFEAKEGIEVDFGLKINPFSIDSNGIIDYRFDGLDLSMSLIPVGPTAAQITTNLKLQGTGAARGRATNIIADLLIQDGESEATVFTGHNMSLTKAQLAWGQRERIGQCTWRCNRTVSSGALTPVFTIA
jgi:hypothetical protein